MYNWEKTLSITDKDESDKIMLLGRALNSPIRLDIMRMLNEHPLSLTDIARAFNIHVSSAAVHVQILLDAELIAVDYSTNRKGSTRYFTYNATKSITLSLREIIGDRKNRQKSVSYRINIGDYIDGKFDELSSGIASETESILENRVNDMFIPERHRAQLLYTHTGYVTYALPNAFAKSDNIDRVELMLEICSEAFGYNETYQSDISFTVNGKRVCTYTSPGDFGARYGKYTPDWWYKESTKYGLLVTIAVAHDGVWLNGELVNKAVTLKDLNLAEGNKITLRIGVEDDAKHKGGFNLFGEKFGDYDIPIVFTAYFNK